jgi:hypothetical protein
MKKLITMIAMTILLGSTSALAATTLTVDMDVEVPQAINLQWAVSGASVQLTGASAVTTADVILGYKEAIDGGIMKTSANDAFDITVETSDNLFIGGSGTKSTSELFLDLDGAGTYVHQLNGTNAVTIIDEQPAATNELHSVNYKLLLNASDTPGIYATDLTYTILID